MFNIADKQALPGKNNSITDADVLPAEEWAVFLTISSCTKIAENRTQNILFMVPYTPRH
jgi:hypothetical protein